MRARVAQRQTGFTLLEVLVAVVIIAIGLLGLLQLQTASLANTQVSAARTQAMIATESMSDRMAANPKGIEDQEYDGQKTSDFAGGNHPDLCNNCTPAQLANYDMQQWTDQLQAALPSGQGFIDRVDDPADPSDPPRYVVLIRWHRVNADLKAADNDTEADDHGCSNDADGFHCLRSVIGP